MKSLKNILNITYPIVQAPMLGVTSAAMVAAVSNAGALGSLPLGGLSPEKARELIRATKALTDQTFSVNLFAHSPAKEISTVHIDAMQDFIAELCAEFDIPFEKQDLASFHFYYYQDLIDVIIEESVAVVSFTFGELNADVVSSLKNNGSIIIGTATCVAEAKALAQSGTDIITVQGAEAGGHRGSFLSDGNLPQVGLFSLLPQVSDELTLPLLAAGGIYNAKTVKAAFALGAMGIQVGSLFIPAEESLASEAYKKSVLQAEDTSTTLTRAFSGKWARGIENQLMTRMASKGLSIPYYTFQNQLMAKIRSHAQLNNLTDFIALWAGQSAGKSVHSSTHQIITKLIAML